MAGGLWHAFDRVSDLRGPAPALVQGEQQVSFTDLRLSSARFASTLQRLGVQPGDRCLVWAGNSPDLATAILASWRVGAIVALVNDEAPVTHFAHAAAVTQPRVVIVDPKCGDAAGRVVTCPLLELGQKPIDATLSHPVGAGLVHDFEPASVFFTSGSTGLPKGVTQSHASLMAGCRMVATHLGLGIADRILCPIPWAFDYGYGQFLSTVLLGITQILPGARNPFAVCEAIAAHQPTVFAGLPSLYALLLRGISPLRQTDLQSLRLITNTGGQIPPAIFAEVQEIFAHCDISLNYGMTETYRSAGLPVSMASSRPDSVGFAYPGVKLAVLRDTGEECEPGEIGQIIHRGTGTFLGYWGAPEATREVLRPDPLWQVPGITPPLVVFTGDLGWMDETGLLRIKGRRDRLIKSMGVRISPDEIETSMRQTRLVRDVAVVGIPHEIFGEMVVAAIVPQDTPGDPVRALKAHARREMSQSMQPRDYRVLEALPLTPNGKTDYAALRALWSGRMPAPIL